MKAFDSYKRKKVYKNSPPFETSLKITKATCWIDEYKSCYKLQFHACIRYPESVNERKYPKRLKTIIEIAEETGLWRFGTIDTTIPEQAGRIAPPKNKRNHSIGAK